MPKVLRPLRGQRPRLLREGIRPFTGGRGVPRQAEDALGDLRIEELSSSNASILTVGEKISISARIHLAGLSPEELGVELYYGALTSQGEIEEPRRLVMEPCGVKEETAVYCAEVVCYRTGQGYTVRIMPRHKALVHPFLPGLVK